VQSVDPSLLRASVAGAVELVELPDGFSPRRLSEAALAHRADDNIRLYSALATGVRLRLFTAAERLDVTLTAIRPMPNASAPTLSVEVDGTFVTQEIAPFSHQWADATGKIVSEPPTRATVSLYLPPSTVARTVALWLPHDAEVTLHDLTADAPVTAAPPSTARRWVHHGSSISHALEAPGPHGPWPQRAARDLGLDLTNLSIAGQAMLDPFVARTIAREPADLITLKLGINLVNADAFGKRSLGPAVHGFLDTVRAGHPSTPIVVITAIACPIHEHTPGPTIAGPNGPAMAMPRERHPRDGRLTLSEVRAVISAAVLSRDDPRLYLLDGLTLFGPADVAHLPDNLHPDLEGNDLIGSRFVAAARDAASPLGRALRD
jgi:hypothetical protein